MHTPHIVAHALKKRGVLILLVRSFILKQTVVPHCKMRSLGLNPEQLRLRKNKQQKERYPKNRESLRAARETFQLKRGAAEALKPELCKERQQKEAGRSRKHYAKCGADPESKKRLAVKRREYRAAHMKEINAQISDRRKTDTEYALALRLRSRLNHCLRGKAIKKTEKTLDMLGCTVPEAVKYLETNPRGLKIEGNHIDHIRALISFNLHLPSERRMANHYLNLQLLTPEENLAKGVDFDYAAWSITENGSKLIELGRG